VAGYLVDRVVSDLDASDEFMARADMSVRGPLLRPPRITGDLIGNPPDSRDAMTARLPRRMARFSLLRRCSAAAIAVFGTTLMSSCLITSTPDFGSVEQTPPFLLDASATPSSRDFLVIPADKVFQEFSAEVRSEDAGEPVEVVLYIDYGVENGAGLPYRRAIVNNANVDAGSFDDAVPRIASSKWYPGIDPVVPGCHSFTLMVSHSFDNQTRCPSDVSDSSQITWQAVVCATADDCSFDPQACPKALTACGDAQAPDTN
jgi:hypothetical protein